LNLTLQLLLPGQVLLLLHLAACYFNIVSRAYAIQVQLPGQELQCQLVSNYSYPSSRASAAVAGSCKAFTLALLPATDATVLLLLLVQLQPFYSSEASSYR
jgi:hypothetical protein